jgi:hypothetical protein
MASKGVPELSPCLSYSTYQLTNSQQLHSHARLNLYMPFKKTTSQTEWVWVYLTADGQLTSIGLPFGAHDQILSLSFLFLQLLCCSSCRALSLTRGRVCNFQCNRWLVRSLRTNNHTLLSRLRLCSLFVASYNLQGLRWRYSNPSPHGYHKLNRSELN